MTDMNLHSFKAMKNSAFEEVGKRILPGGPSASAHLLAAAMILALIETSAYAGDVSFSPQGQPPYLWSLPANWVGGALPGTGDNVILSDAALGTYPLVVDGNTSCTVNQLHLKPASGAKTLMEIASGASITASSFNLGNSGSGASYNGKLARIDNYGTVNVAGFFMGRGNSSWASDGTPTIFYNHAGATFAHTGTGSWNFYLAQNGGDSLFINEGAMSNTSGSPLWTGLGKGKSELRIQGDGVFTANGDIRMGHGYPSTSYIVLANRGQLTGSGVIHVGHGNGQKATGYLVLSNDASIVKSSGRITLGTNTAGAKGYLQMHDNSSVSLNENLSVGDGVSTTGTMTMDGGSTFAGNVAVVANANNSTGMVSLAGNSRFTTRSNFYVGGSASSGDGAAGSVSLADAATADIGGFIYIGTWSGSHGEMSLSGTSRLYVTNDVIVVGYSGGSAGTASVSGNAEVHAVAVRVGQSTSRGLMNLSDSATLYTPGISVVGWGNATGTLVVGDCAVVTNVEQLTIGNFYLHGPATLAMRGGSVFLDVNPDNPDYIQNGSFNPISLNPYRTAALGSIRGWGKVAFSDPVTYIATPAHPCGMTHYGQVVADGEGVTRDLDFSRAGTLNYSSTEANPSGTNGWFAVNKGRLRLPRSLSRTSNAAFCVGDCSTLDYAATPRTSAATKRLANTFSATFTGAATGNYIFADLYASDRDDIPVGIDAIHPDKVISVWRIGLFSDGPEADEPSTPSDFTSADLRFRIPGDATAGVEKLYVIRHDGTTNGKWEIAGRARNPDANWPVIQARVDKPSAADWNVGWFAVIEHEAPFGTILVIR